MDTIDVFRTARVGSSLDGRIAIADMPRLASSLVHAEGALSYHCQGRVDERGRPVLVLQISGVLPLLCDRCGGELDLTLRVEKTFFFVCTEEELAAVPIDESPEEALIGNTHFDLAGLIEDEAILHLPISPRHEACVATDVSAATPIEREYLHPFAPLAGLRGRLRPYRASAQRPQGPATAGAKRATAARKMRRSPH